MIAAEMTMSDELARRKALTFAQAEGAAPPPRQLARTELSPSLRSRLSFLLIGCLRQSSARNMRGYAYVERAWYNVVLDYHIRIRGILPDEFDGSLDDQEVYFNNLFRSGDYLGVFESLQHMLRHRDCPHDFKRALAAILIEERCAYRIVDGDTLVPIGSDDEAKALDRALSSLEDSGARGAKSHLRAAGEHLSSGNWGDSVRESVHAVEATARLIHSSDALGKALAELEKTGRIHPSLRKGFGAIYGYTSDEGGIRHPLVDEPVTAVDEADALFMIGACASFVSYLIAKARAGGIEPT